MANREEKEARKIADLQRLIESRIAASIRQSIDPLTDEYTQELVSKLAYLQTPATNTEKATTAPKTLIAIRTDEVWMTELEDKALKVRLGHITESEAMNQDY